MGHLSKSLRKTLVNVKDKISQAKRKGTIYEIQCDCGEVYIGETGSPIDVRLNEHAKDIEHGRVLKSAPARHAIIETAIERCNLCKVIKLNQSKSN